MGKIAHVDVGAGCEKTEFEADSTHSIGGTASLEVVRSASKVVAANDSLTASKAMSDDTCDGTDDDVEIQAMIDGLP